MSKTDLILKFEKIITWYSQHTDVELNTLNTSTQQHDFEKIESMIEEPLPNDFKKLYSVFNGESGNSQGVFIGHSFLSLESVIEKINFSLSLRKPKDRTIPNPIASQKIIDAIILLSEKADHPQTDFFKIDFTCSPNSISGINFFINEKKEEKVILKLDREIKFSIMDLSKQLHALENETYNWDELRFTIFPNKKYQVERIDYDFDEELPLTSYPLNFIKKKYSHWKWLPLISDYGGNFIGLDLDPDVEGTVGQVIVYGRDEEDMFVLANDLESFFDLCLLEIEKNENLLLGGTHLHDYFRKQKT